MNIFFVDKNPILAARSLCDKHIVRLKYKNYIKLSKTI